MRAEDKLSDKNQKRRATRRKATRSKLRRSDDKMATRTMAEASSKPKETMKDGECHSWHTGVGRRRRTVVGRHHPTHCQWLSLEKSHKKESDKKQKKKK